MSSAQTPVTIEDRRRRGPRRRTAWPVRIAVASLALASTALGANALEPDDHGRVAWHNGGNGWSFAVITRPLDEGLLVLWVTNRVEDAGRGWSLYRLESKLTRGVVDRLLEDS